MKLITLCAFVLLLIAITTALPAPGSGSALSSGQAPALGFIRSVREIPAPKKDDLDGSESAYLAYPYYYPGYWGHYVLVGK